MINFMKVHTCLETCETKREKKIHANLPDRESNHGF